MGFDDIVSLLVNNGIGVVCIIYFMYRDYHFMQKLTEALASLTATLDQLRVLTNDLENERGVDHDI